MSIQAINPVNGKVIKVYKEDNEQSVIRKIEQTHKAWLKWRDTTFTERATLLKSLAANLKSRKNELAVLMANEMGKPLKDGVAEIEKCASVCEYYADNGADFLADKNIDTDASKSFVSFQPIGVVLAIMPWNFPFWQVFRFLAPGLMAGNCGLLKHASNVTLMPICPTLNSLLKTTNFLLMS